MEYRCLTCDQVFQTGERLCSHLQQLFSSLHGEKVWRIRFLHRYTFEFYSDPQMQELVSEQPLTVSEVLFVEQFDARTFTGLNALGVRVSIFD